MNPRSTRWVLVIPLILILIGAGVQHAMAQQGAFEYFDDTGHTLSGEFLIKYFSIPAARDLIGSPITGAFLDERTGWLVQYFDHARFELHPNAPPQLRVVLTPIGEYLYERGEIASIPQPAAACEYFAETGYQVCYAFLDYFEAYGGYERFGYPISGLEYHQGWLVQYFQFARFEWHPELAAGQRVQLTNLGDLYFAFVGEDPARKEIDAQSIEFIAQQPILNLQVRAFTSQTVTPLAGRQTIYVIVQRSHLFPIEGAQVKLTLNMPDGTSKEIWMGSTNELGISILSFDFRSANPGLVEILVTAEYGQMVQETRTSYQIWR